MLAHGVVRLRRVQSYGWLDVRHRRDLRGVVACHREAVMMEDRLTSSSGLFCRHVGIWEGRLDNGGLVFEHGVSGWHDFFLQRDYVFPRLLFTHLITHLIRHLLYPFDFHAFSYAFDYASVIRIQYSRI